MLGKSLEDPYKKESINELSQFSYMGISLLPIQPIFGIIKHTSQREDVARWPEHNNVKGFEMHYGESHLINHKDSDIIS